MKSLGLSPPEQEVVDMQVVVAAIKATVSQDCLPAGRHEVQYTGPVPLNTVHYGQNVHYCSCTSVYFKKHFV